MIDMLKIIPLEGTRAIKSKDRICNTCLNYLGKNKCQYLNKIKNPDEIYCSFWKEKSVDQNIK